MINTIKTTFRNQTSLGCLIVTYLVMITTFANCQENNNTEIPNFIKYNRNGTITLFEGEKTCFNDIEPYLLLTKNELALEEFNKLEEETYKFGAEVPILFLTIATSSAALGQIGQDDGRGKIYLASAAVSIVAAVIAAKISGRKTNQKRKKIVALYNTSLVHKNQ